jgi:hypothetical protein
MTSASPVRFVEAEAQRLQRVSEVQQSFRARVLDGIPKVLEDPAMAGKTGAREFCESRRSCTPG